MATRIPFRNRAHEVSRIESFSDVIFGFAVSLLVVSLEAPKSYAELVEMMKGFLPFAIALNTVLLFVILFNVYPLKFVFVMSVNSFLGQTTHLPPGGGRPKLECSHQRQSRQVDAPQTMANSSAADAVTIVARTGPK